MVLAFGGFELDGERFELRRGGAAVKVEPRVLEVLLYLAAHRDRVVAKHELIENVWGVRFVSESALSRCIHEARKALGEEAQDEGAIKTVYGRGYRFVAEVAEADGSPPPVAEAGDEAVKVAVSRPHLSPGQDRRPVPRSLGVLGLILVAAALVAAVLRVSLGSWPWEAPMRHLAAPRVPSFSPLTSGIQDAVKPAFSPDGATLLFLAEEPGGGSGLDIYLMSAGGGVPIRLTHGVAASGDLPVFSADGGRIVFARYRTGEDGSRLPDLWQVSRFGGEAQRMLEGASGAGFSPDGEWVAYTRFTADGTPLWLSRVSALDEYRELAPTGFAPRWSPDGSWLAYTTSNPQRGPGELWLVRPSDLERRQLTELPQQMYGLTWARDGRSVVFAARYQGLFHLWQVSTSGGYVAPLTTGLGEYTSPTVSPNGKRLVFCSSRPVFTLTGTIEPAGSAVVEVDQPEHHSWPRLAPSRWQVASVINRPDFDESLYLTDLETRKQLRLSDRPARHPCWIGDDEVAYLQPAADGRSTEVRVSNVATDLRFSWTSFTGMASWLAVHPDRTRLAVVLTSPGGGERIVVRDLRDLHDQVVVAGGRYQCLRWVPGGDELSWSGPEDAGDRASNGVWLATLGATAPIQLAADGYGPCWGTDRRAVFFSRIGPEAGLWRLELSDHRLTRVRPWGDVTAFDLVGERLFFIRTAGRSQIYSMPLDQ